MEKLPQYDGDLAKERLDAENSGEVRLFTTNVFPFDQCDHILTIYICM